LNRTLFLSRWMIDPFLGAVENRPLKPAPDGVHEILRDWQFAADQVFYVGDTDTDMHTATAAGVFAVGAAWGFRGRKELETSGAEVVFDTASDFQKYLRSLSS